MSTAPSCVRKTGRKKSSHCTKTGSELACVSSIPVLRARRESWSYDLFGRNFEGTAKTGKLSALLKGTLCRIRERHWIGFHDWLAS